jgi:hypothetical protein
MATVYLDIKTLDMVPSAGVSSHRDKPKRRRTMQYTLLGEGTAPGADLQLSPEEIAQIELMLRADIAVGGPAPEAMPRS